MPGKVPGQREAKKPRSKERPLEVQDREERFRQRLGEQANRETNWKADMGLDKRQL